MNRKRHHLDCNPCTQTPGKPAPRLSISPRTPSPNAFDFIRVYPCSSVAYYAFLATPNVTALARSAAIYWLRLCRAVLLTKVGFLRLLQRKSANHLPVNRLPRDLAFDLIRVYPRPIILSFLQIRTTPHFARCACIFWLRHAALCSSGAITFLTVSALIGGPGFSLHPPTRFPFAHAEASYPAVFPGAPHPFTKTSKIFRPHKSRRANHLHFSPRPSPLPAPSRGCNISIR
jgi:hypothetical protein